MKLFLSRIDASIKQRTYLYGAFQIAANHVIVRDYNCIK
jgi:hypothetical protein